ncbi:thiopurine S-methyltransferase [Kushneria phosphatilytica]|uniref:Thiopurine S-methyltransferase n=1 Tax=Kushneria phosphatilytica TaxID=657387 RepID=A0A1S1NWH4_9GAMM|nr:thiopurine S-methyltransferase [Kushneria phosphatilytica]OHV12311.1 thiopurine S-methyltransferase [Kushneria phosphatilytica]QEL11517.1 thiopurine S-methyltransferase [Kushneria phosphatilytica]
MSDPHEQWLARWREGRIGFHLAEPHPRLIGYWAGLGLAQGTRILVPLCGKTPDMRWLAAQGHEVIGVELASEALEAFVAEGDLPVEYTREGDFERWKQGRITLHGGDFFRFRPAMAGELSGFYDRAALIALPPPTRQRYALHLAQLMPPGSAGLLIALTHAGGPAQGPPYAVDEHEVRRLFEANFRCEWLRSDEDVERGMCEHLWRLVRRGPGQAGT